MTYEDPLAWPSLALLVLVAGATVYDRFKSEETPKERVDRQYREGEITLEEYERRLEVLEDPEADRIRECVEPIPGIGEQTSWYLAERFDSVRDLEGADVDELEDVAGVGPTRAEAIKTRL